MSEQPTPAAPAAKPASVLRDLLRRVNNDEFKPGQKDFHQFVVKEIYPLLGNGTLTVADFERLAQAYSARSDPYNQPG